MMGYLRVACFFQKIFFKLSGLICAFESMRFFRKMSYCSGSSSPKRRLVATGRAASHLASLADLCKSLSSSCLQEIFLLS